jgi:hypothetical protein
MNCCSLHSSGAYGASAGWVFFDRENTLYVVSVRTGSQVEAGMPTRLPVTKFLQGFGRRPWEVTPDGKRFLVMFL